MALEVGNISEGVESNAEDPHSPCYLRAYAHRTRNKRAQDTRTAAGRYSASWLALCNI